MGNKHSHDEHSQGEHPHNSLHQRDCTYKLLIEYVLAYFEINKAFSLWRDDDDLLNYIGV